MSGGWLGGCLGQGHLPACWPASVPGSAANGHPCCMPVRMPNKHARAVQRHSTISCAHLHHGFAQGGGVGQAQRGFEVVHGDGHGVEHLGVNGLVLKNNDNKWLVMI